VKTSLTEAGCDFQRCLVSNNGAHLQ